ncbi:MULTISPECIES: tRNA dihydrouridine(20/20a) synthase DusA [unclassified Thioalkalivibrio]|uniref:tRNA dihydrouridine(20/20a) synthase DusA n=1 Tax=unclassified Thioalkalivibrio TaxID=2621013 RepID=UPI00036CF70B|nr:MULTISPECIES: tRNA dihydrouridine(20/20a) synthase DusA [unclassified Thioalkalivibrio]
MRFPDPRFSVAPMMDWTDSWCRRFHRLLTRRALLYTEMVHANAVIHGDRDRLLGHVAAEHPLALQLGGSDPDTLAQAARIAAERGFDEINLNVGCPSDRVQSGTFGACLMAQPEQVARMVRAMQDAVDVPVTVKHRIGIDEQDSEADLRNFVETVARAGCRHFIVHARKAWLQGLSPKDNRDVPPLDYERVFRLKAEFPELTIVLNGGLDDVRTAHGYLERVNGVMFGRLAYHQPWVLSEVDRLYFDGPGAVTREAVLQGLVDMAREMRAKGVPLARLTRHVLGLFHGEPGARQWRRILTEGAHRADAGPELIERAAEPCLRACA